MSAGSDRETNDAELLVTERTRLRRGKDKGRTARAELHAMLADGFVCHLGVVVDGTPMVVPTVYGATDDTVYFHGSVASRSLVAASEDVVCLTVTHVDGIVLARSAFEHSVNYRSAMIYGVPRLVVEDDGKLLGLRVLTEQAMRGQWDYVRRPTRKEMAATTLLALPLDEASVKVRTGPPDDGDGPDADLGLWAGVVPLINVRGTPQPDPALPPDVPLPPHLRRLNAP
ncbi:pyridoxamine 5'-phosphate oxidase family protein [Streptomyces iakyrus]|uniref:pyridoxamine 5'-phosphate oxidase family protein n=1 Tax=Streptomyces iakyrus TaxID=68219 RepID=UPI001FD75A18|nr:pyridoxamine 5'-phosphate oxidase family protein [Streptomyces iakyrus]